MRPLSATLRRLIRAFYQRKISYFAFENYQDEGLFFVMTTLGSWELNNEPRDFEVSLR